MTTSDDPVLQALLATQNEPPPVIKPPPDRDSTAVADSMLRLLRACHSTADTLAGEDDLRDQLGDIEAVLAGRPLHTRGSDASAENGTNTGWETSDDLGGTFGTGGGHTSRPGASRGNTGNAASGRESESFDEEVAAIGTALQARAAPHALYTRRAVHQCRCDAPAVSPVAAPPRVKSRAV